MNAVAHIGVSVALACRTFEVSETCYRLNGNLVQDSVTGDMIFSVAEIIAHMSEFMALVPGDVIASGTPEGVGMGMKPQRFLRSGDVMELEIEGLGGQRTVVL